MKIIRIEHEDGFGMMRYPEPRVSERYTVGDSDETENMFQRHSILPTPMQDGIVESYMKNRNLFCAFSSIEDFNNLCKNGEIKFLLTKNFKVLLLEVSECKIGSFQVMYRKEDIISSQDISSLFL